MVKGSISSVESFGLVDGPGIRAVVFLTGCQLRCQYCHNPEMWLKKADNIDSETLLKKILRFKPYFRRNKGGVTFSGGEPLMQPDFLLEMCKLLKKEHIHIALDTAGIGVGQYEEILNNVDLIIFDVKHIDADGYKELTGSDIRKVFDFLEVANRLNKKFWIRQVMVPGMMDNDDYLAKLSEFIKTNFIHANIEKIEFLPYHTMAKDKYKKLGIKYALDEVEAMDSEKCQELYNHFMTDFYQK